MPRRSRPPGNNVGPRTDVSTISPTPTPAYGEKTQLAADQQAVPAQPQYAVPGQRVAPLAPTQYPGEPVTAGLPSGPGPGPEALGTGPKVAGMAKHLPYLEFHARSPDTPQEILSFIAYLKSLA